MAALSRQIRLFDGALPAIFEERGLEGATETDRLRAIFGTLALYRASAGASNDANG